MTESFKFEIAENLTGNEGEIEGRLAVSSQDRFPHIALADCLNSLEDIGDMSTYVIPIIKDEHTMGIILRGIVNRNFERVGGFLTFGVDEGYGSWRPDRYSHVTILIREVLSERPDFLAVLLATPDGETNAMWSKDVASDSLHTSLSTVTILGNTCTISPVEGSEALPAS